MIHFVNLTRGTLCPHHPLPMAPRFTRIQSTHCEQKNWSGVVFGAGPELLAQVALGGDIVVHDYSERDRETRAMWQGLKFVRRACETFWGVWPPTAVAGRGGVAMERYFDAIIDNGLPEATIRYIDYYRSLRRNGDPILLRSCWGVR